MVKKWLKIVKIIKKNKWKKLTVTNLIKRKFLKNPLKIKILENKTVHWKKKL